MTGPLHGAVKEKVFIAYIREETTRDIWNNPEQEEKEGN